MGYNQEDKTIRCDNDCKMQGCPSHLFNLGYHSVSDHFDVSIDGEIEWGADLNKMEALLEGLFKMSYYRVEVGGIIKRAKESAAKSRDEVNDLQLNHPDADTTVTSKAQS